MTRNATTALTVTVILLAALAVAFFASKYSLGLQLAWVTKAKNPGLQLAVIDRILKKRPNDDALKSTTARQKFTIAINELADAKDLIDQAIANDPNDVDALLVRADIHEVLRNYRDAANDLRRVLEISKAGKARSFLPPPEKINARIQELDDREKQN